MMYFYSGPEACFYVKNIPTGERILELMKVDEEEWTATEVNVIYQPEIHPKKDGLLLCTSSGRSFYLSVMDTILYRLGLTNVNKLNKKYGE